MSLSEEWKQLPGRTKMFIVGGGGIAVFFLFTAIKNKNSNQQQTQQDTSVGPQMPAVDPTSWIDNQNQQMQQMQQVIGGINDSLNQYQQSTQQTNQQNLQAMQDLITQSQQATQQQIGALIGAMATGANFPTTQTPAPPPSGPPKTATMYRVVNHNGTISDTSVGTTLFDEIKAGGTIQSTPTGQGITKGKTRFVNGQGKIEDTDNPALQQQLLKQGFLIAGKG